MNSLGHQLREARLAKGHTIKAMSKITKIREDQLTKLENDDLRKMPAPTYLKGFVRNYATALGLNVPQVLQELDKILEIEGVDSYLSLGTINYLPEESKPKREFRPQSLFLVFAGVLLAVIVVIFGYRIYQVSKDLMKEDQSTASESPSNTATPPIKSSASNVSIPEVVEVKRAQPVDAVAVEAPKAVAVSAGVGVAVPAATAVSGEASGTGENQLSLLAKEECWARVSVMEANNAPRVIFENILPAGKTQDFPPAAKYLVKLNPPSVVEMSINGKKYDYGTYSKDSPPVEILVPAGLSP